MEVKSWHIHFVAFIVNYMPVGIYTRIERLLIVIEYQFFRASFRKNLESIFSFADFPIHEFHFSSHFLCCGCLRRIVAIAVNSCDTSNIPQRGNKSTGKRNNFHKKWRVTYPPLGLHHTAISFTIS